MSNSIYNDLNGNTGGIGDIFRQANELKKQLNGQNPKDIVQGLLNSGQMSQDQFNQLSQQANQILRFMPKR
jgi:ABC-type transporter Mla subunit MlaD